MINKSDKYHICASGYIHEGAISVVFINKKDKYDRKEFAWIDDNKLLFDEYVNEKLKELDEPAK